ncbi:MAG TPA: alpha/beta hydrolase-fold protein [Niabella sp.]|nr:alpha/beta hydrolase-fold protein [Niabella sp.]HOZ95929.1 alpha/beta hydrolase-fold protein [Niabella sp.]HQW15841.1 alpha/beta hydrolase-fold protein [Niabella sp.]HQX20981.1 alpha/beta hydrolase-fold protein [Niabella sp.]HRB07204.1 alpha/beta hydrolase-fold protein [Niabella sp.]
MIRLVFSFLFLMAQVHGIAQDSLCIGSKHPLYSTVLKEDRTYRIALPNSYYNKKYSPASYPVLYLSDGEMAFDYYVSIVRFLSKGVYAHIPEMIVVGIDNTDRTRDLTPSKASKPSPDDSTKLLFTNSGGADHFLQFITTDLIPSIESSYRTNGFKVFAGHSFGGLFSSWVLLNHPDLFDAYLIHDPSLWWDNQLILKQTSQRLPKAHFKKTRVYLSQANNEDKGGFDEHFESIKRFNFLKDSMNNKSLTIQYRFYENEDHGTIPFPASFDGLKFIFDGFWCDFKKISSNKNLLMEHYKAFSRKTTHSFNPSEPMLDFIVKYFKKNNKKEEAEAVLKQYQQLYPKTAPTKL